MADNYSFKDAGGNTLTHASEEISAGVHASKHVNVDDAGAAIAKAEDSAHSSGDKGYMLLAVRQDTATSLAGSDGDYIPLIVDSSGRLHIVPQTTAGDVAHDASDSGNPVKIGGKAATSTPTAVSAGDRVNAYFDANGRLVVNLAGVVAAGRAAAAASIPVALATEDNALLNALAAPEFLTQVARVTGDDASHQLVGVGADTGVPTDYAVAADTILSAADPTYNFGITTQLVVGYRSTGWRKSLVSADFSALTDTVLQASLFLYHKNDALMTANQNVRAYRVLAANDWTEGGKNGATGTGTDPTWNKRSVSPDADWAGSAGLSTSGTDYSATLLGEATVLDGVAGWVEIALDTTEFDALLTDNYGVLLTGEYMNDGRIAYFHSSEYTTDSALRPYFRVWTPAAADAVRSIYLIADGAGATWSNSATSTTNDAPIPTAGITVPAVTSDAAIMSIYVPSGVNVWWAAIG